MGFAGYLVKPVRLRSLIERVKAKPETAGGEVPERSNSSTEEQQRNDPALDRVRRLKILVAEDNPINALLVRKLLERRGHFVNLVQSGDGAVSALHGERFDLFLTDLHMPGLDGFETVRAIRAAGNDRATKSMPIVALTADALDTTRQACQDAGINGFLAKPIDPAELDSLIASLVPASVSVAAE